MTFKPEAAPAQQLLHDLPVTVLRHCNKPWIVAAIYDFGRALTHYRHYPVGMSPQAGFTLKHLTFQQTPFCKYYSSIVDALRTIPACYHTICSLANVKYRSLRTSYFCQYNFPTIPHPLFTTTPLHGATAHGDYCRVYNR